jgi:hypothetical protein
MECVQKNNTLSRFEMTATEEIPPPPAVDLSGSKAQPVRAPNRVYNPKMFSDYGDYGQYGGIGEDSGEILADSIFGERDSSSMMSTAAGSTT